jgi:putative peptidoglycan lipid II flippase
LRVVAAAAALLLPTDSTRLVWLVAAILAGELAAAGTVLTRVRRAIQPERFLDTRGLAAALVATLALLPVAAAMWWIQQLDHGDQLVDLAILSLGGVVALGIYVLVLRVAVRRIGGGS